MVPYLVPHLLLAFINDYDIAHLIFIWICHFELIGLSCLVVDTCQGVYPDLQRLEDIPFLLKGFVAHHDDDLFLLGGIHHDDLLIGGYLIQGDDPDPAQITTLLLLSDVECILHPIAAHLLFVDAEHHLLLKDVDRPLQCADADHPLQYADADHPLRCADADHPLQCDGADHLCQCDADHLHWCDDADHHHLLDSEGHPRPCDEDLLLCGIGRLHLCAACHQLMVVHQALPWNPPLP